MTKPHALAVNVKLIDELEKTYRELVQKQRELIDLLRALKLLELINFYEKYSSCSVEETWVLNKIKKKYYYYYVKCKDGRSIYLGKSPEYFNVLKKAAQSAVRLKEVVDDVNRSLGVLGEQLMLYIQDIKNISMLHVEEKRE